MNVLDAINSRHSYRGKYKDTPVPRKDLITIMQAGLNAPSGCNKQTTSLIAVDDPNVLAKLRSVIDPPVGETAPAAVCVLTQRINAYRDKCFAVQDYSAAIENMLLAAVELGYQSCWYEGHITDDDRIGDKMAQILNVPDGYELVCFLPVGIAENDPVCPNKKAFEERAWFNSYPRSHVVLLNGPSSSGKSTLARALQQLIADKGSKRYEVVSIDDFLPMSPDETIYEDDVFSISDDLCKKAQEILETGAGVIIDHVITSERIFERLKENLSSSRIQTVCVTCPLQVLRTREQARGNRCPGSAEASAEYLFPKEGYDLTVDTGTKSPEENALMIFGQLF